MYRVKITPAAQKDLLSLKNQKKYFGRIKSILISLGHNQRPLGTKKLTQREGHRIRVGNYRILYQINDEDKTIHVFRIRHRSDVYR
ncbi:type II toxin-antitoxin system RelE/ParE family toxin [bacterium]|nr:type II toxin-antitoxin system RelE/ParE family toxin [bacterium]